MNTPDSKPGSERSLKSWHLTHIADSYVDASLFCSHIIIIVCRRQGRARTWEPGTGLGTGISCCETVPIPSRLWRQQCYGYCPRATLSRWPGCCGPGASAQQNPSQEGVADQTTAVINGDLDDGLITEWQLVVMERMESIWSNDLADNFLLFSILRSRCQ